MLIPHRSGIHHRLIKWESRGFDPEYLRDYLCSGDPTGGYSRRFSICARCSSTDSGKGSFRCSRRAATCVSFRRLGAFLRRSCIAGVIGRLCWKRKPRHAIDDAQVDVLLDAQKLVLVHAVKLGEDFQVQRTDPECDEADAPDRGAPLDGPAAARAAWRGRSAAAPGRSRSAVAARSCTAVGRAPQ